MKPILFNTDMVRAILDGRKTVTRRVIKCKSKDPKSTLESVCNRNMDLLIGCCPYRKDDILYVRETFCYDDVDNGGETIYYRADYNERESKDLFNNCDLPWRPSIHMPREVARLFLRVTDVRVERLQDITPLDCEHEGALIVHTPVLREDKETYLKVSHDCMRRLWDSTIKKSGLPLYGWDANPWVWVIEFERCEKTC